MRRTIQSMALMIGLASVFGTKGFSQNILEGNYNRIKKVENNNLAQPNKIILKLKKEVYIDLNNNSFTSKKIEVLNKKFKVKHIKKQRLGIKGTEFIYVLEYPLDINLSELLNAYYATGEIEYAEPDYIGLIQGSDTISPNDSFYFSQWGLKNDGSFPWSSSSISGADIDMENAWSIEKGDSNIVVSIIDIGNKLDHPEFKGRIWKNLKEIPGNGLDDDINGYIDDLSGWDFANNDNDPTDDHGHGTHLTGIIGANGNDSLGIAGIDWNCKLMCLKAMTSNGSGSMSWWADAIYYSVDNGAKVINMSIGTTNYSKTLHDAINYALNKNVVVVSAMGNFNSSAIFYPAAFKGVIAVGATNPNDTRSNPFFWSASSGSNFGNHISVVAPGNYIIGPYYQSDSTYTYFGGTSQAGPHVAGLAALLFAQDSSRTPEQIKTIIELSAEDQVGKSAEDVKGWDKYYGHGRINAYRALLGQTSTYISLIASPKTLAIWPNPSSGDFTVSLPSEILEVQIFNSLGQLMLSRKNPEPREVFTDFPPGLYFLKAISTKGIQVSRMVSSAR